MKFYFLVFVSSTVPTSSTYLVFSLEQIPTIWISVISRTNLDKWAIALSDRHKMIIWLYCAVIYMLSMASSNRCNEDSRAWKLCFCPMMLLLSQRNSLIVIKMIWWHMKHGKWWIHQKVNLNSVVSIIFLFYHLWVGKHYGLTLSKSISISTFQYPVISLLIRQRQG